MADYADLVQQVINKTTITICTPVGMSSLRRGINKVIKNINEAADIFEDDSLKFKGDVSVKPIGTNAAGKLYILTYYPDGRPLPECFKSKFNFEVVEVQDADPSRTVGED
jgi:hypothetical protein